jgi:hypothetical protein
MKKPTFFISSTIKDFQDLRSSIKWWLEENDYSVNASEYNDFNKPLDINSYEACLAAIDNSDYFVLLIGERIGGMYDDEITITQKEYRHAYERLLLGKIKIINLVRKETWINFSNSKKQIEKLKKDPSFSKDIFDKIYSKDDQIRFNFIDEVRRAEEMKEGKHPPNNWIHNFATFEEITEVFKRALGFTINLSFKQNRFIILNDIQLNLQPISKKDDEGLLPIGFMSRQLFGDFELNFDEPTIVLNERRYLNYASFFASFMQLKPFRTSRIESFYKSGFFLEYNPQIDDYVSGDMNQIASSLLYTYERLNGLHKSIFDNMDSKILKLAQKNDKSHLTVKSIEIFFALGFYDEIENCFNLSTNLYKGLSGAPYLVPKLIKNNRLQQEMKFDEADIVTEGDIRRFLEK